MATIYIILAVLINQVNSQTSLTALNEASEINSLPEGLRVSAIFPSRIQQIQTTSETTPAASAGNNLNVIGGTATTSLNVPEQNFQPISTIYSVKNKKSNNDKNAREGNIKLLSDESDFENTDGDLQISKETGLIKPEALVWDNCLETNFNESPQNIVKPVDADIETDNYDYSPQRRDEVGGLWRKRDAGNLKLNSTAGKAWLEKYNNLLNSKSEERRQQKPDLTVVKKTTTEATATTTTTTAVTVTSSTLPTTTVQVIPITRDIFEDQVDIFNTTQSEATESDVVASYTEDWFEEKDRSKIRFGDLPQKQKYLIPALKLEEGFHPFQFMSEFFYLIYPFDFPVGKEFLLLFIYLNKINKFGLRMG